MIKIINNLRFQLLFCVYRKGRVSRLFPQKNERITRENPAA
jgi:hypothetical protein